MITAKAIVHQRTETGTGDHRQVAVKFVADYADGRNKEWAAATPVLNLEMTMSGAVAESFPVGARFELRFEPDAPASPADVTA